jgi:hypothetical protein
MTVEVKNITMSSECPGTTYPEKLPKETLGEFPLINIVSPPNLPNAFLMGRFSFVFGISL